MKKLFTIVGALILLTSAIAIAKPSDFNDNSGEISATVGDSGFNEDGWNLQARIFSGNGDKFGYNVADHLIVKWSSEFNWSKLCNGNTSFDNQTEGAWFMLIIRRADNSVDRGKVECGSSVANISELNHLAGCNCYEVA